MLNILRRIVQEINNAHNLGEAFQILVQRVREAINADACTIFLYDARTKQYLLIATDGLNPSCVGQTRLRHDEGIISLIGKQSEVFNLEDATAHTHYAFHKETGEEDFFALLGAPIIHHRQLLGVIIVQQKTKRRFEETEEAFLLTLAAQLATIISHSQSTGALNKLLDASYGNHEQELVLFGLPTVPGFAVGKALRLFSIADLETIPDRLVENIEEEIKSFHLALDATRDEIASLSQQLSSRLTKEDLALFDVYLKILESDTLINDITDHIKQGFWAQSALKKGIFSHVKQFEIIDDPYLHERANDLKYLGQRILSYLQNVHSEEITYHEDTILVGNNITAGDLAHATSGKIRGIVSAKGSVYSHVAILARAMSVPTVMGINSIPTQITDNTPLIVDGHYGQVIVSPSEKVIHDYHALIDQEKKLDIHLEELRKLPSETLDGYGVPLLINVGLPSDAAISLSQEADGIGLYRTEVPFMIRDSFPSEEEQRILYKQLLKSQAPKPVIMRTLDIGGDKSLPYFPIEEENPSLGWRGIRVTLDHPEIFLTQVRAMLMANIGLNNLRIMLPMISTLTEIDDAMLLIQKAHQEVLTKIPDAPFPPVGVMIEVPSAVYQSDLIAQRVDFVSIGSNDLTQYLLAVDRNNPHVASLYDTLHPAVLYALIQTVENVHRAGKMVSICGEMAGDPLSVILLLAMGFDALSMNASSLLRIKWVIRSFTLDAARQLLQEVLTFPHPHLIRKRLKEALEEYGLGKLIHGLK
ncbi:MAG: hypothetical protein ACD_44C00332G0003 [uncultured bacterium]|nr:MAG: hypothetical protein ACD_44C00332G0003 [uncultured bacterium]OGT23249.1 MAG: phosphoenolpyruvate--protein phosphotransferase [Gammaproteobacteria bacterium RIFCSPHIGHO2_12_38_15]OGT77497.1 MAG: phosphoenolpyruvate--protein phosphotransferase [Gammaproteobacteria bacterium RIFCSPLOWO2_12_FULL_38_14]